MVYRGVYDFGWVLFDPDARCLHFELTMHNSSGTFITRALLKDGPSILVSQTAVGGSWSTTFKVVVQVRELLHWSRAVYCRVCVPTGTNG